MYGQPNVTGATLHIEGGNAQAVMIPAALQKPQIRLSAVASMMRYSSLYVGGRAKSQLFLASENLCTQEGPLPQVREEG